MSFAKRVTARSSSSTGTQVRRSATSAVERFVEEAKTLLSVARGSNSMRRDEFGKLREFMQAYSIALDETRRTGHPIRITVDVQPKRPADIKRSDAETAAPDAEVDLEAALSAARERGQLRVTDILSAPDMMSADAFANLLGVTRATVNTRRQNRHLLGLEGAKRGYRFPRWQVSEDGQTLRAMPQLFELLGDSPWAVYRFLVQHHPETSGLTGLEALQRGRVEDALAAAENAARAFA